MRRLLDLLRSHIRYKIILPYLALSILVALAGAAIVLVLVAANAQDVLTSNLASAARATSDALVRREQGHIDYLRQVASAGASVESGAPSVSDAIASGDTAVVSRTLNVFYLVGISNINLDFDRMIAFDRKGRSLIDWQRIDEDPTKPPFRNESTDLTPIPDVQRIVNNQVVGGDDKFSGLLKFGSDPQPYFYTIVPVRQASTNENGDLVGGLMIAIKADRLLQGLQRSSQTSITTFYNFQGEAIGTTVVPRPELPSLNMRPEVIAELVNNKAQSVVNAENDPNNQVVRATDIQRRDYLVAYSPLQIQQRQAGYFSVALPTDFQVNAIAANRLAITMIALGLALGSILLGFRISRSITRPLASLVDAAEAVTAGDFDRRTTVQSGDELGRLSLAFNQMTEHLLGLYRTSRELGNAIEIAPVLDVAYRAVNTFVPGTDVLALIDERGTWRYRVRDAAAPNILSLRNLRVAPGDPLLRDLAQGRSGRVIDPTDEARLAPMGLSDVAGFHSLMLTPLVVHDLVAGMLIFGHAEPNAFNGAAEPTLAATANMAASVLYNAVLFDRVHEEASEREAILKSIADGVVVCDRQRNIMLVNRTAEQMLNLHDWHIVRRNWNNIPLERVPAAKDMFGNEVADLEHYQLGERVMSVSSAPVIGENDEVFGEVIVLHDMTAEAAVDRAKTKFIERVSHELRTPLTPICGNTELLLRGYLGDLTTEQRDTLEVVRLRADQMRDLVNNFVMIASIEANTLATEPEPQDVSIAIDSALAPLRSQFAKKNLDLHVDMAESLPPVRADRQQLHVILTQLLDNARRYTQSGTVTIRATHNDNFIQVNIADTGPGITPEEFEQLFTRFHRVEGNNSPERGGGLGLAITRQLVERQGGTVWAESTPGHGSTFSFTLPIAHEHADAVTEHEDNERSA